MNIVTKLVPVLITGLVITACSSGSSGSSTKPNSESAAPKTNMPESKKDNSKITEPQMDNSKANKSQEIAPQNSEPAVPETRISESKKDNSKIIEPQMGNAKPKEIIPQVSIPNQEGLNENVKFPEKSNAEILKELGIKDISQGELSVADTILDIRLDDHDKVSIVLLNDEINRKDLKVTNSIPNQDIRTLKDASGKLLGYYGYMQLSQVREDANNNSDNIALNEYYLLSMNDAEKIRPAKSIEYKGNMFYGYKDSNEKLVANVQAAYNDSTKKLSMEIFGDDGAYWKLGEARGRNRLLANKVQGAGVGADGTISNANLYSKIDSDPTKLTPDANFSGSIFGKNGEVLAGSAISEKWRGVIGATATEKISK